MGPSARMMSERIPEYDEGKLRLDTERATGSCRVHAFAPDGPIGGDNFCIQFSADAKVIIARDGAEANFQITLKWANSQRSPVTGTWVGWP